MGSVVSTPTPEAVSNVLLQACDAVPSASPYRLFSPDVHVSRPPDLQFAVDEKQQQHVSLAQLADTRGATLPERVTGIPTRTHATGAVCEGDHVA
jgi:hypothetical protein